MAEDARFEDAGEAPINLGAFDQEDLQVLSAMVQDAVFPVTEIKWQASQRRLGLLLNRFRWEDHENAKRLGREVERVQSLLLFENVIRVASQGVDRKQTDTILSVLALEVEDRGTVRPCDHFGGRWRYPRDLRSHRSDAKGRYTPLPRTIG